MSISDSKNALRGTMRRLRDAADPATRARASEAIAERVGTLPRFGEAARIALYADFGSEVGTLGLDRAAARQETVYPRVLAPGELGFFRARRADLSPGTWNILEPPPDPALRVSEDSIDLFVVPGLAFDAARRRLGYGRGYYDRALALASPGALTLGIAFDLQIVEEVPAAPSDVRMSLVVTESRELT